jgi:hypothetical protein
MLPFIEDGAVQTCLAAPGGPQSESWCYSRVLTELGRLWGRNSARTPRGIG